MKLVNAESLAAALRTVLVRRGWSIEVPRATSYQTFAERILAAIPPDPHLDALLAGLRWALEYIDAEDDPRADPDATDDHRDYRAARDALAAFGEPV